VEKYPQLQNRLAHATVVVNTQLAKMRILDKRFVSLDRELSGKVAINIKNGDTSNAKVIARELVNIRKIKNITQKLSIALEVIVIRFSTISEFAGILDTINPMINTIKEVQIDIDNTVPHAKQLFSEMSSLTDNVLINTSLNLQSDTIHFPVNTEALDILNEVQSVMEEDTKNKLPEVPTRIHKKRIYKEQDNEFHESQPVLI
jgi:division protein CdvB (Snf7/Vps24/ESCRT-III family)